MQNMRTPLEMTQMQNVRTLLQLGLDLARLRVVKEVLELDLPAQ